MELESQNSSPTCLCPWPWPHTICSQPRSQHPECSSISATGSPSAQIRLMAPHFLQSRSPSPYNDLHHCHLIPPVALTRPPPPTPHPGLRSALYTYQAHSHVRVFSPAWKCNLHPNHLIANFLTSFKTLLKCPVKPAAIL